LRFAAVLGVEAHRQLARPRDHEVGRPVLVTVGVPACRTRGLTWRAAGSGLSDWNSSHVQRQPQQMIYVVAGHTASCGSAWSVSTANMGAEIGRPVLWL
jgi:hypothetical protein